MQRSSASALAGDGRPRLEKIVDSRATTGRRRRHSAVATSSDDLRLEHGVSVPVLATRSSSPSATNRVTASTWCVMREQVEHLGPLVPVAVRGRSSVASRAERHRVAADEHEHRRAGRAPALPCPACRARCGPDRRSRRRPRSPGGAPRPDLAAHDPSPRRPARFTVASCDRPTATSRWRSTGASRARRRRREQPDAGVGVDARCRAVELRAPPARTASTSSSAACGPRLEERAGRHAEPVSGDVLVQRRVRRRSARCSGSPWTSPWRRSQHGGRSAPVATETRSVELDVRIDATVARAARPAPGGRRGSRRGDDVVRALARGSRPGRCGRRPRGPSCGTPHGVDASRPSDHRGVGEPAGAAQRVGDDRRPWPELGVAREVLPVAATAAGAAVTGTAASTRWATASTTSTTSPRAQSRFAR